MLVNVKGIFKSDHYRDLGLSFAMGNMDVDAPHLISILPSVINNAYTRSRRDLNGKPKSQKIVNNKARLPAAVRETSPRSIIRFRSHAFVNLRTSLNGFVNLTRSCHLSFPILKICSAVQVLNLHLPTLRWLPLLTFIWEMREKLRKYKLARKLPYCYGGVKTQWIFSVFPCPFGSPDTTFRRRGIHVFCVSLRLPPLPSMLGPVFESAWFSFLNKRYTARSWKMNH